MINLKSRWRGVRIYYLTKGVAQELRTVPREVGII